MPDAALPRRMLGLAHLRLVAFSLLLLGASLGFTGILVLRQAWNALPGVGPIAAVAAGALVTLLPGRGLAARTGPGKRMLAWLYMFGMLATAGMAYLSAERANWAEPASLALMGGICVACLRLSAALVFAMLPPWRPGAIMGLCGASVGVGGALASLVGALISRPAPWADPVLLGAAAVPAMLALISIRARWVAFAPPAERWGVEPSETSARPRSVLLCSSLLLQATACALVASWLTSYLLRRAGFSLAEGVSVMALFWVGLACGWALGLRLSGLRDRVTSLFWPLAFSIGGAVSLAFASSAALALAGVAALGLAAGSLLCLTLRLGQWPRTLGRSPWVMRTVHLSLAVALLGSWAASELARGAAFSTPLWIILGCLLGAAGALFVLIMDYRMSGDPAVI